MINKKQVAAETTVATGDLRAKEIIPRTVMCSMFWVGIILVFTGIILLVTSKHKGG